MSSSATGDPALSSALTAGLNKIMAQYIHYAPGALQKLSKLEGKVLKITCTTPPFEFYLELEAPGPKFVSFSEKPCDCAIKGSLPNLVSIAITKPTNFADTGVTLSGRPFLLQALQDALSESDFDWQGPIHDLLGDYLGPVSAHLLQKVVGKAFNTAKKTPAYLAEYLSEEANYLLTRNEFQHEQSELQVLREQVERLDARINKLASKQTQKQSPEIKPRHKTQK